MKPDFFIRNRQRLSELTYGTLVLSAGPDAGHGQADSAAGSVSVNDLWYLSGVEEPGWQIVIDGERQESLLIAPEISETERIFDGGIDFDEAKKLSGVDKVIDNKAGDELKKKFSKTGNHKKALAKLRAIKQVEEIEIMKSACQLTGEALNSVKGKIRDYRYEYQVEADISHHFRWHNATHAFAPIVASGKNACTLHYAKNDTQLKSGAFLLIDVGARTQMYAADITRTFAVDQPTTRQSSIHMAVQSAQAEIINLVKPGVSLKEYSLKADCIMKEALLSVGLMKNSQDESSFRRYYPHAVSHGLGIDVHESLGGYNQLQPGMVLTVEPGIYIPEEGIGVRIEDDILVTDDGHVNLTAGLSTDL